MTIATTLVLVGRSLGATPGPIFPAMPIWFSRRPRDAEDAAHARDDRRAAEEAARITLDRFLDENAPAAGGDVGVRGPTLTRLEACMAGLVAAAKDDPRTREWLRRLDVVRVALARAIARDTTAGSGGAA
jgi:hypothetical protein